MQAMPAKRGTKEDRVLFICEIIVIMIITKLMGHPSSEKPFSLLKVES